MSENEKTKTEHNFRIGAITVRRELRLLERDGEVKRLEPRVMDVLLDLATAAPRTVSREALLARHWPPHVSEDALNRALWKLRRALAELDDGDGEQIETVPKHGYRLRVVPERLDDPGEGASPRAPRNRASLGLGLVLILVAMLVVIVALRRPKPRDAAPTTASTTTTEPLTSLPGYETAPTFSATGRMIFAHYTKTGPDALQWDLYERYPDGRTSRLTTSPEHEVEPVLAPDGLTLAHLRVTDTTCAIVLRRDDGSEQPLAACGPDDGSRLDGWPQLAWSPSGALFFSDRRRRGEPRRLWRLDTTSGQIVQVSDPPAQDAGDNWPAVSPRGDRLAFVRSRSPGRDDLWTRDLASGIEERLTSEASPLAGVTWTSDGEALIFSSQRSGIFRLWRIPARGGEVVSVPAVGRNLTGPLQTPRGLVYEEWQSRIDLWRLDLADGEAVGAPWIESTRWSWMPTADPSGRRIAFLSDRDGAVEVWLADEDAADGAVVRLTELDLEVAPRLAWSPDGASIAVALPVQGSFDLHLLDPQSGAVTRLNEDASDERAPTFTPDAERLIFASDREAGWQLWSFELATSAVTRLTSDGGFVAAVSPDGRWIYLVRDDEAGIWRRPLEAGPDVLSEPWVEDFAATDAMAWTVIDGGVAYLARAADGVAELRCRDEAGRRRLAVLEGPAGPLYEVWSDSSLLVDRALRRAVVASLDHSESDLWLQRD